MILDPWYVTGLIDGEGSFCVQRTAVYGKPVFSIGLRADDLPILVNIQRYFGCGKIYGVPRHSGGQKPQYHYSVIKLSDLVDRVIPHFEAYPPQARKQYAYRVWKEYVFLRAQTMRKSGQRADRALQPVFAPMVSRISELNRTFDHTLVVKSELFDGSLITDYPNEKRAIVS